MVLFMFCYNAAIHGKEYCSKCAQNANFKLKQTNCVVYILLLQLFQYTSGKDGRVIGVTNTRSSLLCHSRTLTVSCNYTEGITLITT